MRLTWRPLARRIAALSLPFLLLLGLIVLVVHLIMRPSQQRRVIERDTALLAALQSAVAERPALERELQQVRAQQAMSPTLLPGASTALAAAAVQSEVKRIVDSQGGEIKSAQNGPSVIANEFEKIEIRYTLSASLTAAIEMIYQIETHTPYLFVDGVELRTAEGGAGDAHPAVEPKLTIRWNVYGYRWMGTR